MKAVKCPSCPNQTATDSTQIEVKKKRKVSETWDHFTKIKVSDKVEFNHCRYKLTYKTIVDPGTSHLSKHIKKELGQTKNQLVRDKKVDERTPMITHR